MRCHPDLLLCFHGPESPSLQQSPAECPSARPCALALMKSTRDSSRLFPVSSGQSPCLFSLPDAMQALLPGPGVLVWGPGVRLRPHFPPGSAFAAPVFLWLHSLSPLHVSPSLPVSVASFPGLDTLLLRPLCCLFRLIALNSSCNSGLAPGGGVYCFQLLRSHVGIPPS